MNRGVLEVTPSGFNNWHAPKGLATRNERLFLKKSASNNFRHRYISILYCNHISLRMSMVIVGLKKQSKRTFLRGDRTPAGRNHGIPKGFVGLGRTHTPKGYGGIILNVTTFVMQSVTQRGYHL